MQQSSTQQLQVPVAGRDCGTCTLCCKVLRIDEVESPAGEWCKHCAPGKGCRIHPERPDRCRDFYCMWLSQEGLGPEWKPERSKIVLRSELNGQRLAAHVDPGSPGAWRRTPYFQVLKRWSADALAKQQQVSVWIGMHCIVILPDKEIDLGVIAPDEVVVSMTRMTPQGPEHGAEKMKLSDVEARQREWAAAKQRFDFGGGDTAAR
jgi:hypothetical protein